MEPVNYIAYYRVSTKKQGKSGLSLENQQDSAHGFIQSRNGILLQEYTEVETGTRKRKRIEIFKALQACKEAPGGAILLISSLDRLSRDAEFIFNLMNSGVKFQCIDMPEANETTIGIMAVLAQDEARRIKERCKKAVATKKKKIANGTYFNKKTGERVDKLGFEAPLIKAAKKGAKRSASIRAEAARFNNRNLIAQVCSLLVDKKGRKLRTYQEAADELNNSTTYKRAGNKPFTKRAVHALYNRYCLQEQE